MIWIAYAAFLLLWFPVFVFFLLFSGTRNQAGTVRFGLSLVVTVIAWTSILFLLRVAGLDATQAVRGCMVLALGMCAISFRYFKELRSRMAGVVSREFSGIPFLTLLGVHFFLISGFLFRNGSDHDLTLYDLFPSEVAFHLSIVSQLNHSVFPSALQYVTSDFSSYHYFSNLFIGLFTNLPTSPDPLEVYVFFFDPLMISILALLVYALTMYLTENRMTSLLASGISLFCYDLTSLVLWARALVVEGSLWFGSTPPSILSYWTPIVTQFQLFHNPSFLFSSALLVGVVLLSLVSWKSKHPALTGLTILSWVFLFKAKISAFFIGFGAYGLMCAWSAWREKNIRPLWPALGVVILVLPLAWMSVGRGVNSVVFSNWYFPVNFGLRSHVLSEATWRSIRTLGHPVDTMGWISLVSAFGIYHIGLLGFRLLPLIRFVRSSAYWQDSRYAFILTMIVVSFIPFVFLSSHVVPHDTMWFYLHSVFLLNILTAIWFADWVQPAQSKCRRISAWSHGVLLGFGLLSFVVPVVSGRPESKVVVPKEVVEALAAIRADSASGRILSRWYDAIQAGDEKNYFQTAFTGKPVVSEGLQYMAEYRLNDSVFVAKTMHVRNDIDAFFGLPPREKALEIVGKYDVRWILAFQGDTLPESITDKLLPMYMSDSTRVYRVRR